jgi:peptidoglycan/LPS O-acetylase OafA/YrhL
MNASQSKRVFRYDINGLRAWAVIAVVIYHLPMINLPGGFVGVDIFFVISGFLMTSIVLGSMEKGSFSIIKFYMSLNYLLHFLNKFLSNQHDL